MLCSIFRYQFSAVFLTFCDIFLWGVYGLHHLRCVEMCIYFCCLGIRMAYDGFKHWQVHSTNNGKGDKGVAAGVRGGICDLQFLHCSLEVPVCPRYTGFVSGVGNLSAFAFRLFWMLPEAPDSMLCRPHRLGLLCPCLSWSLIQISCDLDSIYPKELQTTHSVCIRRKS